MEKLKTCPFCGGLAFIERSHEQFYVKCYHRTNCYLVGRLPQKYNIREAAVRMWNRRVDEEQHDKVN